MAEAGEDPAAADAGRDVQMVRLPEAEEVKQSKYILIEHADKEWVVDFPPFANSPRSLANNFRIDRPEGR